MSGSINLRLDRRNVDVCRRNGQSAGQRINTIIDRYAQLIDSQRARVLGRFGELELDELSLALKPIEARRSSAVELRQQWLASLANIPSRTDGDVRGTLAQMNLLEIFTLADALEGRQVNMAAQS